MVVEIRNRMQCLVVMLAGMSLGAPALADGGFRLSGVVRDFKETQPCFNLSSNQMATVMGLVESDLNDGLPEFSGEGRVMSSSAVDASGRPVMSLAVQGQESNNVVTDFSISGDSLVPRQHFAVELRLIGAAIENGSYELPVTCQVQIGNVIFEPFGAYSNPVTGNVNDIQTVTGNMNPGTNPRTFRSTERFDAGSAISITGKSWTRNRGASGRNAGDWSGNMTVFSTQPSDRLEVLRDGGSPPNYAGAFNQASIAEYLRDYVDANGLIKLEENQAIYLFELGTSTGGDFQDLVVLATLVPDPSDFAPAAPACVAAGGSAATLGAESNAGINSAAQFAKWFADAPGVNLAKAHTIEFQPDGNGAYVFSSQDFAPINGELFGNESSVSNRNFTFAFEASFEARDCGRQYFEFQGAGDVWVFIDGRLAMDLGGMSANGRQIIDMDRLGLDADEPHDLQFFYAQRADAVTPVSIRTNIVLSGRRSASLPGASMMVD